MITAIIAALLLVNAASGNTQRAISLNYRNASVVELVDDEQDARVQRCQDDKELPMSRMLECHEGQDVRE
ncbi:hypothetical protein OAC12_06400 [Porticoccaceae bacterium]|nr:hypothetical protein [Porticoccaceae bacterium]